MKIGVIGGTGFYDLDFLDNFKDEKVETAFGFANVRIGSVNGEEVAFLARHGVEHSVFPHQINHKANIAALKLLGVRKIIGTAAVGSMNELMPLGCFVLIDQFIDISKGNPTTFFDATTGVIHLDYTNPYCSRLRNQINLAGRNLEFLFAKSGCYAYMSGPRFETAAEIKMLKLLGADVVGMTNVPEAELAREAQMCYACVAMVTNWATGISASKVDPLEVSDVMKANFENVSNLIRKSIEIIVEDEEVCECERCLDDYLKQGKGRIKFCK